MNPTYSWVKIFVPLLLISAVLLGIVPYGTYQFRLGRKAEQADYLKRDNAALTTANAKLKSLEEQYRQQENNHATALASISSQYQKDLTHVKADKDRVIAGLRAGVVRLFIPAAAILSADGSAASAVAPATAGRDGETRYELSESASEFLVGLTAEADEVANQLGACQAVINADRNTGDGNGRK